MSRVSSALFISCESDTGRPLRMLKAASYFLGLGTNRRRRNDDFRRKDELDDEDETWGFAGPGRGAAVRGTGKGNGAGGAELGRKRCANGCANRGEGEKVAGEQSVTGR